jgi:hypothetical protein
MDISISNHTRGRIGSWDRVAGGRELFGDAACFLWKPIVPLFLSIATLFLVACSSGRPAIGVEATTLDLGTVTNGEIVSRDVVVRNEGTGDLIIDSLITSCTCTQATVTPMAIPAGGTGVLHIEFDSGFHGPDLTGPLIRQVFINSNDPHQPELMVEFSVLVESISS